jgi:hypothetical protein
VPVLATKAVCTVEAGIADIKARIEEIEGHIASLTPITSAIRDLKEQLKSRVDEIKTETISEGTDVIGTELDKLRPGKISFLAWKDAFTKPTDAATLNAEFSTDKGGTGLLAIPDIAARVTQEFHGGLAEPSSRRVARRDAGDDSFDGTQFAVARNAVTLAKIAMLDQKGLRQLATEAKLSYTIYGENLYDGKSEDAGNVLYGFAKNIDGNHQWHRLAPPHPRVTGFDAGEFEARRTDPTKSFTYVDADTCEPTKGMRMWLDPLARSLLFGRIFVGPMPAAIDLPQAMDPPLSAVLPVTYPNGVSTSLPWGIDGSELPAGRSSRNAILVGRGRPGSQIELFRGSDGIGKGTVDDTGRWRMEVPMALSRSELLTMKYADRRGRILGDVTTSYCQPAVPEGAPVRTYITVVKSDNLWRIAQLVSGNGRNYVSLFEKNKHLVRDEDLIYPNQLLALPDESEWKYDPIR